MVSHEYCSLNSQLVNEQIFATASCFKKLLLIENSSVWTEKPLRINNLSEKINHFIEELEREHSIKILFIKNKEKHSSNTNIFTVDNNKQTPTCNHFILNSINDILNFSIDTLFSTEETNAFENTLYLICTNGKKDKCCAKFGIPILKELMNFTSDVWECTHVGGDRFAPNVIHLPHSHFYGHLTTTLINDFYNQTTNKQIYFKNYRGRSSYSNIEQAAEYFLRNKLSDYAFNSIDSISVENEINNTFSIKTYMHYNQEKFMITLRRFQTGEKYFLTCNSKIQKPKKQFELLSIEDLG